MRAKRKITAIETVFVLSLWVSLNSAYGQDSFPRARGAIVRGERAKKGMALVFTGDSYAEGGQIILDALKKYHAKGSFFLTGNFLRHPDFQETIRRIVRKGHYLGPHSDRHLLYLSWESNSLLIGKDEFIKDVKDNLAEIAKFRVEISAVKFWIPPYEHYNETIAGWSRKLGLTLINYTPGAISFADYTLEKDANFVPAQKILDSILKKEKEDPNGLNGFILLSHIGAGDSRKDKFFNRFDELLELLCNRSYKLVRIDQLLP